MSQKAIREYDGKRLLHEHLEKYVDASLKDALRVSNKIVTVGPDTDLAALPASHPWLLQDKLVAKPDQLIKRRGQAKLLILNQDFAAVKEWIEARRNKHTQVDGITGRLTHFIIEPFLPHQDEDELYVAMFSVREGDEILFYHKGGIHIGDVDSKGKRLLVPVGESLTTEMVQSLCAECTDAQKKLIEPFVAALFQLYKDLYFSYFEINPVVVTKDAVVPLDIAAKVDQTAEFICSRHWGALDYPPPFGRDPYPEEAYIADLDSKTGSSLKLTILNPEGRVWMMVAGGGASVVYADAVADIGQGAEMANYGEYSGAPSDSLTFEYARTILTLMTKGDVHPQGKVLIVGGGIANFTNVAETFNGIIRAVGKLQRDLLRHNVHIYVRRGGPNFQEGLMKIKAGISSLGIPISVYGPNTHITSIVSIALGGQPSEPCFEYGNEPAMSTPTHSHENLLQMAQQNADCDASEPVSQPLPAAVARKPVTRTVDPSETPFISYGKQTRCIVYGLQVKAVQRMLDFDYISKRNVSVAAIVYPFAGDHYHKFHWGAEEVLLSIHEKMSDALKNNPDVDVVINFASFRSVYASTMEAIDYEQVRTVAIIAEGVPEQQTKLIIKAAEKKGVTIIGPATVGGIVAGAFRIGNTGGAIDNIISSRLYRPGSVGYVSKSGGMSNELNNIISHNADGVYEGVAIGGDRYPGTVFIDHLLRYEDNPEIKMLVLLGEVGGTEEYRVCEALKSGRIKKPIIAWCVGTCAKLFPYEVQFGHAGALAGADSETADAKNRALREAGAIVPDTFEEFGRRIKSVFTELRGAGVIAEKKEPPVPVLPMDYDWAAKLGLIRKPASFISTITDDRGEELLYAGMPISKVFEEDLGIGGVVSLLWFQRRLPPYACKFIEMIMMVTADHGPAVSGAHNTIVTARAGKDLISALCSGLLTIGPRFGGAVDGSAVLFSTAYDNGLTPHEFVNAQQKKRELILGIGHRIKSLQNPDMRVVIIKEFAKKHFPNNNVLNYALEVEQITTKKRPNLILNVDGCLACCFVDLVRSCGAFSKAEADEYVKIGCLNGLFVLGRTIGFIGHYLDQKRLKQNLYRHNADDISYFVAPAE